MAGTQFLAEPQILEQLGDHTSTKVYKVTFDGKQVFALKRIQRNENAGIRDPLELFVLKHIKSPYLVSSINISLRNDLIDILQPLAECNLSQWNKRAENNLSSKLEICKQVLQGIYALHSYGLIHGDVKPENVLIFNGTAKLADFGLTVIEKGYGETHHFYTISYRPPECWSRKLCQESDIWAWALTTANIFFATRLLPIQPDDSSVSYRAASFRLMELIGYSSEVISQVLAKPSNVKLVEPKLPMAFNISPVSIWLKQCLHPIANLRPTAEKILLRQFSCYPEDPQIEKKQLSELTEPVNIMLEDKLTNETEQVKNLTENLLRIYPEQICEKQVQLAKVLAKKILYHTISRSSIWFSYPEDEWEFLQKIDFFLAPSESCDQNYSEKGD